MVARPGGTVLDMGIVDSDRLFVLNSTTIVSYAISLAGALTQEATYTVPARTFGMATATFITPTTVPGAGTTIPAGASAATTVSAVSAAVLVLLLALAF